MCEQLMAMVHRRRATPARRSERGTALVLVPTMLLVLLLLGGLAVDMSLLHASQRRAERIAAAAADDAAGMLDLEQIQLTGQLDIEPTAARRVAAAHVTTASQHGADVELVDVRVDASGDRVRVRVRTLTPAVLLRSLPGRAEHQWVSASATGRGHR